MKTKYILLALLSLIIITAVITNPKKENHLDKVFNEFIVNKNDLAKTNSFELMALPFAKNAFGEILSVDNYVFFSIGKIKFNGINEKISIGFFGNVFLTRNKSEWDNLGSEKNEDKKNTDNSKTEKVSLKDENVKKYTKIENKIYGDFNGDGITEYVYFELEKKGFGNPVEDGEPDIYKVKFSNNEITPIKREFNELMIINEGDLDNDGADEITIRENPMNGCIGWATTYSIKNNKPYILIDSFSFYSGACDNDISINPDDLVEKNSNSVFYYEYDAETSFVNYRGKKIFGKRIKAFDLKLNRTENELIKSNVKSNDVLNSIKSNKDKSYSENGTGKGIVENPFGSRKALIKPAPKYNCNEEGIVVVEIVVDKGGNVIKAYAGAKGTTNNSKCLLDASKEAALKSKWEANENAPEKEVGIISYNFSLKE